MDQGELFSKVVATLQRHGVKKVAIFGSYARGDMNPDSDLDVLVRFSSSKSLLEIVRIERELGESTGVKVDLVTEGSVSPYLRDYINKDSVILFQ